MVAVLAGMIESFLAYAFDESVDDRASLSLFSLTTNMQDEMADVHNPIKINWLNFMTHR